MTDWDDVRAKPAKAITLGEDLYLFSVGELEQRIAALKAEIARLESELQQKRARQQAADALFKR